MEEGWGHIMRGVAIRSFLKAENISCRLVCEVDRALGESIVQYVKPPVELLPIGTFSDDALMATDLRIVDRYHYDPIQLGRLAKISARLLVFDELQKISFETSFREKDTIVRAQLVESPRKLPAGVRCQVLNGLKYFVLNRPYNRSRVKNTLQPHGVLVMLGGGDGQMSVYNQIAEALISMGVPKVSNVTFILGPGASEADINMLAQRSDAFSVVGYEADPLTLMSQSRLGVMSGGYSKYEAAYCGLPSIMVAVHEHQEGIARAFAAIGGSRYAGPAHDPETFVRAANWIVEMLRDDQMCRNVASRSSELIDGEGMRRIWDKVTR